MLMATECGNLGRFVDGELPPPEADGFRRHLAACAACESGLHDMLQLVSLGVRHHQRPRAFTLFLVPPPGAPWKKH